jgi:hypothetical protein
MPSTRIRRIALALVLLTLPGMMSLWLSCTQLEIQGFGYDYLSETYMESLPEDSTRAYWLKLYRIMEIVNDTVSRRLQYLDIEEDRATIDSLVEDFKKRKDFETRPDTPDRNEWWEEIWNVRAAHCDSFYHTPLLREWWDMRARPVIIHGIPEMEHKTVSQCCVCDVYYQDWPKQALFLAYLGHENVFNTLDTFACEGAVIKVPQGKYLDAFVNREEKVNPYGEITKQIKAAVNIVSFPEGEDFTLWMSSGVGLSQYVTDSVQRVSFHQRAIIHRLGAKPTLVFSDSTLSMTLPLPDSVNDLDDYWFPLNLGGCRLPAGEYDIYLTLYDDHATDHVGAYRTTVTLPSPRTSKGISEILIALQPAGRVFEGTANRIIRGDYTLLGNPAYCHRGDTIYPYMEIDLRDFKSSPSGKRDYTVLGSLYRAKGALGKPVAEIGDVFEVSRDTVNNAPSQQFLRKPQQKGEALIFSATCSSAKPEVVFHEPMVLPKTLPAGKYYLVISAQDASSRKFLTSWREIRIKK